MNAWMETAIQMAEQVYADFLGQVVEGPVLAEREGALSEEMCKRIAKETHIDPRVVRLMAISGKGGWSEDPLKRERYLRNTNITLLDHLLSVVRGALMLAALDCLGCNPEMDAAILKRRLRVIGVLAFLHDLDKMLELERDTQLPLSEVEDAMRRYGLHAFLGNADVRLSADQIRYLIEKAEASQAFRSPSTELPPREFEALIGYVALADKLDGIWLSSDPENGGLKGELKRLKEDQTLHTDGLRQWRLLELFDPHHPFLLDELQRWLSVYSFRLTGVLPLIEVHQDGRLFMLLPETEFERIVDIAIKRLCGQLPFQLEMGTTIIPIRATTLTPFAYHSLMVQSGTSTLPELIGDRAIAFGLASTLGMMAARVALPSKDYHRDLSAMPYRCSVLTTDTPRLLPPLVRRLNLDAEAGLKEKIQNVAKKGNLKDFFLTQEVPAYQVFHGAIFGFEGFDPFARSRQKELVIRIGLHRNGMVKLEPDPSVKAVRLNASTAALFGHELPVERYCLHYLQLTPSYPLSVAAEEVATWRA